MSVLCFVLCLPLLLCALQEVGLALRTLLATVDETIPTLPASTHREVGKLYSLLVLFTTFYSMQKANIQVRSGCCYGLNPNASSSRSKPLTLEDFTGMNRLHGWLCTQLLWAEETALLGILYCLNVVVS